MRTNYFNGRRIGPFFLSFAFSLKEFGLGFNLTILAGFLLQITLGPVCLGISWDSKNYR